MPVKSSDDTFQDWVGLGNSDNRPNCRSKLQIKTQALLCIPNIWRLKEGVENVLKCV
jgi:hypothetical protein